MASIDELRQLARHLPPNFQVPAHEALDIVGALVQVVEHGDPIVHAATEGAQAVADFYHDVQVQRAKDAGQPEPVRGAPVQREPAAAPAAPAPAGGITPQQFAELLQQVQSLAAAVSAQQRPDTAKIVRATEPSPPEAAAVAESVPGQLTPEQVQQVVAALSEQRAAEAELESPEPDQPSVPPAAPTSEGDS